MSRRQTLPPAAREILAGLAKALREAPVVAEAEATQKCPDHPEAYVSGWLKAEVKHSAESIDRLLAAYAPKGGA